MTWFGIGITIEQCARTWSGVEHQHKAWESVAPGQHPLSLFFKFLFFRVGPAHMHLSQKTTSHGWVPPTSSYLFSWVGPAHTLLSVIYTTIPSRRPSVKDIIGYVKKFISFYFDRGSCIMSCNILYVFYNLTKRNI